MVGTSLPWLIMGSVSQPGGDHDPLDELIAAVSGGYPSGLDPEGLAQIQSGGFYFDGTAVPVLGPQQLALGSDGLAVPSTAVSTPMDYFGVYATINEYFLDPLPAGQGSPNYAELFGDRLIASIDRTVMVLHLCMLNAAADKPTLIDIIFKQLTSVLKDTAKGRLTAWLNESPRHQVLARQPLLAALLRTVTRTPDPLPQLNLPPFIAATLLSHAVGVDLNWGDAMDRKDKLFGGFPEEVAVDLISNQTFYDSDDIVSLLDRNYRIWRDYEAQSSAKMPLMGGRTPDDLLFDASGLHLEDFLAYGFALIAHPMAWELGKPFGIYDDFGGDTNAATKKRFVGLVSRTVDELAQRLTTDPPQTDWDFFALKESPVIRVPDTAPGLNTLVVADMGFVLEKITTGLFWIVHDHVKTSIGEGARIQWTQAWGQAVERMVEEDLEPLAPQLLGGTGKTFFTEEDLQAVYPGKAVDVVIDFGSKFAAFEIVSGRLNTDTVKGKSPDRLRDDMEKIVYKKVRQLHETTDHLLADPEMLVGPSPIDRKVQPIVIAGGGFPLSPITAAAIAEYCGENSYFGDSRVLPLAVVTVDEVEMLEGLGDNAGADPCDLIAQWKQSSLANMSLRNWLLERFGRGILIYRPSRMKPRFDELTEMIRRRLELRDDVV